MKKRFICMFLILTLLLCGCKSESTPAQELTKSVAANAAQALPVTAEFKSEHLTDAATLLKGIFFEQKGNVLISPLSIQTALTMAANGAGGRTLAEIEEFFGTDIENLNGQLTAITEGFSKDMLTFENSIWIRDEKGRLEVNDEFLQKNKSYHKAEIFSAPFDKSTVNDINGWAKDKTDGMIDSIIQDISYDTVMILINALAFEGKWQEPYKKMSVREGFFTDLDGEKQIVSMMHSTESTYLETEEAKGFIKQYEGMDYSFAAVLPKDDTNISDFIKYLDGTKLKEILNSRKSTDVVVSMPKFECEFSVKMNDLLKGLGITHAFDPDFADFTQMAISSRGNIYMNSVIHKTFISVDEQGTKAAAVTKVEMADKAAPTEQINKVILDRPFMYMIVDNSSGLPIFIGVQTHI